MDIKGDGKKGFNIETKMNCETLNKLEESISK